MITESIVVIVLTLIISYLYMRRGKRGMAVCILPLAVLPLICILGYLLRSRLPQAILPPAQWGILIVMIGLICGGLLFGVISSNIKRKGARRLYLVLCGGFTLIFAFAEMLNIVRAM